MRRLFLGTTILVAFVFILFSIGSYTSAHARKKASPANSKQVMATVPPLPKTDAPPPANAVRGGTLRAIWPYFVKNLGYPPEMAPSDSIMVLPVVERLVDWDEKGNLIPWLARSWEGDPVAKTVTYHLRKGVKFHDGTPFNAEAARWTLQFQKDTGRLTDGELVKSIEVVDENTVRITCTEYTSQSILDYGWANFFSPTAFQKNGGKEWARFNAVGTGPFKQAEFKRDTLVRYVKNENYWRKGYPLLDAIEIRWIPDPVTAMMMIEKKDADAGYPNGFDTKMLALEFNRDQAVAVQSYLTAVGIRVTIDLADMGRYFGSLFGPDGWTDLAIAASGINPDATDLFVHFGPRPMTYRWGYIAKSPEFLALVDKALKTYDQPAMNKVLQAAVRQASDDAMVIPLWRAAQASVMQPWVHTDYPKIHSITWYSHQDWMEKHK
jgi:ABC-type transport system substrate-binding protein